jgi:acetyl esterase/lipase
VSDLPDAVLRYGGHRDAVIDVHLPIGHGRTPHSEDPDSPLEGSGGPTQRVVVLLHGGFWKTDYDRRHLRPMAAALAAVGFLVATPEYRRVGPGGTGDWPATANDVLEAFRALPGLLDGLGVRPGPTVVAGHSAGGQLALWLATAAPEVTAVVALAPVCDLREAIRRRLGSDAVRAFLGPVDPNQADPMVLLDDRPRATVTLVHGVDDLDVPVELSRALVSRHPWVTLFDVPGGHFEPVEAGSAAWTTVLAALESAVDGPSR